MCEPHPPVMYNNGPTPTHVLCLLYHSNEIDNSRSICRHRIFHPIRILIVFDDSALVDLRVCDGELSHCVRSVVCDLCQLYEHVPLLDDLLSWPVTNTLFLKNNKKCSQYKLIKMISFNFQQGLIQIICWGGEDACRTMVACVPFTMYGGLGHVPHRKILIASNAN